MTSRRASIACWVVPGLAALALAGCTAGGGQRPGGAPAALRTITGTRAPAQFCAHLSPGFAAYLGHGSADRCGRDLPGIFPRWPHGATAVVRTRTVRGQTVVTATVRPQFPKPTDFYLVRGSTGWLLNSVGRYVRPGT